MTVQPDLFGDLPDTPPLPETISRDRRRTQQQHRLVSAGIHPLTRGKARPDLGTCGSCALRGQNYRGFPKCYLGDQPDRPGPYLTHGAATDCRAWWPACAAYEPKDGA